MTDIPETVRAKAYLVADEARNVALRNDVNDQISALNSAVDAVIAFLLASRALPHGDTAAEAVKVEWVVNDIAELGVKIGSQFFFCYKGYSLTYSEGNGGIAVHDDGSPMHWRPVFKREFGECIHPINYKDLTRIGTVSLDDSDDWKELPVASGVNAPLYAAPVAPSVEREAVDADLVRRASETLRFNSVHLVAEDDKDDALATLESAWQVMRETADLLEAVASRGSKPIARQQWLKDHYANTLATHGGSNGRP
jgi:hypothetical protein